MEKMEKEEREAGKFWWPQEILFKLQASLWRDLCLQKKASCFFPIDLVESDSPCGLNGRARCSVRGLADLLPSGTLFRRGRNQSETGNLMVEKR